MKFDEWWAKNYIGMYNEDVRWVAERAWNTSKLQPTGAEDNLCLHHGFPHGCCTNGYDTNSCGKECEGWTPVPF